MEPMYKKGDKIKIKDKIDTTLCDCPCVNREMLPLIGQVLTVDRVSDLHEYPRYYASDWWWDERWIEQPTEIEITEEDLEFLYDVL